MLLRFKESCKFDLDGWSIPYYKTQHSSRFKFCVVRNPWDRLVSCYSDKVVRKILFEECWDQDFSFFIRWCCTQNLDTADIHIRRQTALFPADEIDYIAKFENFSHEFNYIMNERLGLGVEILNKNTSEHRHYSTYYTDETRALVADLYASDVQVGNYTFENKSNS